MNSNREIVNHTVIKYPGLRFHELKRETELANGTVEHHLKFLAKRSRLKIKYQNKIPRYYAYDISEKKQMILLRLRQYTTSKIIHSLLENECQSFAQLVKFTNRSPGTVSLYKKMLLKDKIIFGNTDECDKCKEKTSAVKFRLTDPDTVKLLVDEYGKSTLKKSADNLSDIFLSLN